MTKGYERAVPMRVVRLCLVVFCWGLASEKKAERGPVARERGVLRFGK